jgi:hypothetical protein
MSDLATCRKCGSPILGNEWFCSNCGERVANAPPQPAPNGPPPTSSSGVKVIFWVLAAVVALGAVAAAGVFILGRRLTRAVEARVAGGASGDGAVGRLASSLGKMAREEKRTESYGCSLLSRENATAITGTPVTRTESTSDSCMYFGVPDPSINPEAIAIKSLPGMTTNPEASKMIDAVTSGMRADVEQKDPGIRAGPGGERLLFAVHASAALSASMELGRNGANAKGLGESVPGLGDEAFFLGMGRMFFVRKGTNYILIQPQFVKDPHGVAIAAAKKVLESPGFGG